MKSMRIAEFDVIQPRQFCTFTPRMRGDASYVKQDHGRMNDLQKFQRVCRVFLARLLMVHGPAAPDLLRQIADELECLERERLDAEM